jgi:hypothetical protein
MKIPDTSAASLYSIADVGFGALLPGFTLILQTHDKLL